MFLVSAAALVIIATASRHIASPKQSFSDTLLAFHQLPLAKRFGDRGRAGCVKQPEGRQDAPILTPYPAGGFGNRMTILAPLFTLASKSGRALVPTRDKEEDLDLHLFFRDVRPARSLVEPSNLTCSMGVVGLVRRLDGLQTGNNLHYIEVSTFSDIADELRRPESLLLRWKFESWPSFGGSWDSFFHSDEWLAFRKSADVDPRSCGLRHWLSRPNQRLAEGLLLPLSDMARNEVVIGFHMRFGDAAILKQNSSISPNIDAKMRADDRQKKFASGFQEAEMRISTLISTLESSPRFPLRSVRIFVSSDVPDGIQKARQLWGSRVLHEATHVATHNRMWTRRHPGLALACVADWYMLALSDILVLAANSTFGTTAHLLGMQGACYSHPLQTFSAEACVEQLLSVK